MSLSCLILAAGGSTRMGRPKQLLTYRGQTLLRRAAETALALPVGEIVVVLGSRADQIQEEVADLPLKVALNPDWTRGMGSSIATGMAELAADSKGVLTLLVDQPHVTPALLEEMILAFHTGSELVAAAYGENLGVPAIFGQVYFEALRQLDTQGGAEDIIRAHRNRAHCIPFEAGKVDVDTPEDYERLKRGEA
jgi:molybdenum cofactor cytidylyltransferase